MNITEDQFRKAMGLFPTGVTVVTACGQDQKDIGITISSFTSLSLTPPQILFCLSKQSKTHAIFKAAPHFVVNVLNKTQSHLSQGFAKHVPLEWEDIPTLRHPEAGCLLIRGALTHIVCEKASIYDGSDHDIIIGKVIDIQTGGDHLPLIRQRGQYLTIQSL